MKSNFYPRGTFFTAAVLQYWRVLQTLQPAEIPSGYFVNLSALLSLVFAALGAALSAYLFFGECFSEPLQPVLLEIALQITVIISVASSTREIL